MKKKILSLTVLLVSLSLMICFTGCESKPALQSKAETFAQNVLAAPSEDFSKIVENEKETEDFANEEEYTAAIEKLGDGVIAQESLDDSSSKLWQNIYTLHSMAASQGYSYQVEKITLTAHGEYNFRYTADIKASNSESPLKLIGSIQFNKDGQINYFTVETSSQK